MRHTHRLFTPARTTLCFATALVLAVPVPTLSQSRPELDRVLAFPAPVPGDELTVDRGALGAWHRIRKLATTASILHVVAHPDDEHSGMLTLASRGWGARTALLSINRGEAGANAIGPELFDALGLIRTRELVLAGRYYGLDDLYFTNAADYGYSKSVAEAFRSWNREAVLEDMVRIIRLNRPLVVVSRFHGTPRDGHGHHHATGLLTPEAVAAAADPDRFPEQITREGLRPWRVLRLFRGGVREEEPHHVTVDASRYSPLLGMSHQRWANLGISLQRSQTSGRLRRGGGQAHRYELLAATGVPAVTGQGPLPRRSDGSAVADGFLSGLDAGLPGLSGLLGEEANPEVLGRLAHIQTTVDDLVRDFDFTDPGASVPELARGLGLLRSVMAQLDAMSETRFQLAVKERQFVDAIVAAAGLTVRAELVGGGGGGAVVVPGEAVEVATHVESAVEARVFAIQILSQGMLTADWHGDQAVTATDAYSCAWDSIIILDGPTGGPYFTRDAPTENHYQVGDSLDLHLPWRRAPLRSEFVIGVGEVRVDVTVPVTASVPVLPYGSVIRPVEVLPAVSVALVPTVRVVPRSDRQSAQPDIDLVMRMEGNAPGISAEAAVELPDGWSATPATVRYDFSERGEVIEMPVTIRPPAAWSGDATVQVIARLVKADPAWAEAGVAATSTYWSPTGYRVGHQVIDHRDLPLARLTLPARSTIRSVEAASLEDLAVGYVMGVGDEVPAAIEELGGSVRLLREADLTGGDLGAFDAIVVGTRAYAVRRDLVENNQRLIDYARRGGNLVVLYQTQEFVPSEMAPYPASLPRGAQEVSEEDAPVRLLVPSHPLLTTPNRITTADFDGWLEQRGSKFFADWDPAYEPLLETHDTDQEPQRGIWLTARIGEGRYSYVALALHRQLPYGVPGAYRILSNLLWPRTPSP